MRTCLCSWSFSCSVWLCFGIFAGSLFGHLPPVGRPSAARCTVFSGPATQMIARPVVWPLLPRQVESLRLCIPGVKSKVGEVLPNASTRRATPVPTGSAGTSGTPMCTFMRLFGDGKHGHAEPIQTFRCQACRTTFSARRDTPLYRLKTPSQQVAVVLSALAEGLDPSAAERVFGFRQATITTWLTRAGEHAQILHERSFCHLWLPHLQLDELRTRLRSHTQVQWLWLVIDPLTKILPVLQLGPRTQPMAPYGDPLPARTLGSGLPSTFHQ